MAQAGRCRLFSGIMPCRPTAMPWCNSETRWRPAGYSCSTDGARRAARPGLGPPCSSITGFPDRASFTLGPTSGSPSRTRGRSRMRESCTYGSLRGAGRNLRPYRDRSEIRERPVQTATPFPGFAGSESRKRSVRAAGPLPDFSPLNPGYILPAPPRAEAPAAKPRIRAA